VEVQSQSVFGKSPLRVLKREEVIVGMGNWSREDGFIKGHEPAPVLKLKRALLQHAIVVRIDEFRTSKACHCCHADREKARLIHHPTRKQQKNIKKQQEEDKRKGISPDKSIAKKKEPKIAECYKVLCCTNNKCRMRYQQRDRNSAHNHFILLKCILQNKERPLYLCKQPSEVVRPQVDNDSSNIHDPANKKQKLGCNLEQLTIDCRNYSSPV
jgi:hypothetical protein